MNQDTETIVEKFRPIIEELQQDIAEMPDEFIEHNVLVASGTILEKSDYEGRLLRSVFVLALSIEELMKRKSKNQ